MLSVDANRGKPIEPAFQLFFRVLSGWWWPIRSDFRRVMNFVCRLPNGCASAEQYIRQEVPM